MWLWLAKEGFESGLFKVAVGGEGRVDAIVQHRIEAKTVGETPSLIDSASIGEECLSETTGCPGDNYNLLFCAQLQNDIRSGRPP
ncbi:MAG: hypothetical protein ABSG47_06375 [Terracidiphilus sp.]|jgi:hypothetical protein